MSKLGKFQITNLSYLKPEITISKLELECKSCGSVKFKQIKLHTYQCEYCGRITIVNDDDSLLKCRPFQSLACAGYIVIDPTRCLQLKIE